MTYYKCLCSFFFLAGETDALLPQPHGMIQLLYQSSLLQGGQKQTKLITLKCLVEAVRNFCKVRNELRFKSGRLR